MQPSEHSCILTYPYHCMGHNRSISNANDIGIPPIDGAIDIVYYDGVESGNAKRVEWFVVIF